LKFLFKKWLQPSVQFKYSWSTEFPGDTLTSYLKGVADVSFEGMADEVWEYGSVVEDDDGIAPHEAIDEDEEQ